MQNRITPKVSVIVASHREQFIEGFVSSFGDTVCESVPTEIIIVADYNIDSYVKKFPEIQWIYVPDKSISAKRNKGIISATGTICAFIDDDCRPAEKWISRAVEFLDSQLEMAGVEGMTEITKCERKEGAYREFKRLEKKGYRTNNIFYRRNVLLEINMFDERFTIQREDVDLAYSMIESGFSIGYLPEIKVEHRFRKNEKWDLLKNCVNRRFDPLLHCKHRKLYRRYIGTPYPPGIALIFITHLSVIAGIVALRQYTSVFIFIDIFVNTFFTIRRAGLPFAIGPVQWTREYVSFFLSPFVLLGALIHGCIRFRCLLLF